ncbi:MAG: hypothetical protein ACYDEF_15985 [Methanosarcina sp.]
MSTLLKDYGSIIPSDMAFLYFVCAVVIAFVLLGLLFFIVRRNARDKRNRY